MVPKTFHLRERRLNPLQDWISEELLNPGLEAAMRPMRLDGLSEEQLSNHYVELAQGKQFKLVKVYCQTILSAFGDVEIALIVIADSLEWERLQQIVVASSREAFRLAETRLCEGTVDLVTVLQTQQALFTAEDQQVVARLARLQAVLNLFQALGGAWLPPGVAAGTNVVR
jgi:outer membrane protein TolC